MDKKAFGKQLQRYRKRAGYSQEANWQKKSNAAAFLSLILSAEQKPLGWTHWSNWPMPLIFQ